MLLKYLEYIFIIVGILLCIALVLNKIYFCKLKDNIIKSNFVVILAWLLGGYIIFAFVTGILLPDIQNKTVMLTFAISPFIIGKFATYQKEPLYTFIQFVCVLSSVVYIGYISI